MFLRKNKPSIWINKTCLNTNDKFINKLNNNTGKISKRKNAAHQKVDLRK